MRAVVVVESYFGNASQVAETIATTLRERGASVEVYDAASAPPRLEADLILICAPTHNLSLPSASSRAQAVQRGAPQPAEPGVQEWLDEVTALTGRVVAIGTTAGSRFTGSAAKAIVKRVARKGIRAERGPEFVVNATAGPLRTGEIERARDWALSVVAGSSGQK
ncbi:flavodoxin family protein [Microbacterium aurum]|jgi:hypothetical protein|uniref:flavodoxin family protein n=1 Tax=Microbacterium aurum TaxID=36805 RepID=UPI001EF3DF8F|nr:hypothetical protein [Microbacterium aurum]MBZ6372118.1 hypothetical protein [Microbacterium hominis]MCG7413307.1 hypothetical protein [Microbacterium aurum]